MGVIPSVMWLVTKNMGRTLSDMTFFGIIIVYFLLCAFLYFNDECMKYTSTIN